MAHSFFQQRSTAAAKYLIKIKNMKLRLCRVLRILFHNHLMLLKDYGDEQISTFDVNTSFQSFWKLYDYNVVRLICLWQQLCCVWLRKTLHLSLELVSQRMSNCGSWIANSECWKSENVLLVIKLKVLMQWFLLFV